MLKVRRFAGVETLSLRQAELGWFAVRREWTDWAPPGTGHEPGACHTPLLIDTTGLLALAELVVSLKRNK